MDEQWSVSSARTEHALIQLVTEWLSRHRRIDVHTFQPQIIFMHFRSSLWNENRKMCWCRRRGLRIRWAVSPLTDRVAHTSMARLVCLFPFTFQFIRMNEFEFPVYKNIHIYASDAIADHLFHFFLLIPRSSTDMYVTVLYEWFIVTHASIGGRIIFIFASLNLFFRFVCTNGHEEHVTRPRVPCKIQSNRTTTKGLLHLLNK